MITIRHLNKEDLELIQDIKDEFKKVIFAEDILRHNRYLRVQDIVLKENINRSSIDEILEEVLNYVCKNGNRKNVNGDIIQYKGKSYMIGTGGFILLNKS